MGLLSRLFGRNEEKPAAEAAAPEPTCPHAALIPRWDSADDIGKSDRISFYVCESCKSTFSRYDGDRIITKAADSVRIEEDLRV